MYSMEPVIKRGFYAWDQAVMPQDEYTERVRVIQAAMKEAGLNSVIVFGNQYNDPDLAYLIGGKVEGAVVITEHGDPVVLSISGGREEYIQKMSIWADNLRCVGPRLGTSIVDVLKSQQIATGRVGTVNMGELSSALHANVTEGMQAFELESFDAAFRNARAVLRSREVLAVQVALDIAQKAAAAGAKIYADGGSNAEAFVEAERVARLDKALDIRVMANIGADELRPFEGVAGDRREPLLLWVATRYQGYWGEAVASEGKGATDDAENALAAMIAAAKAGAPVKDLAKAATGKLPKEAAEAASVYGFGGGIGLEFEAAPKITVDSDETLVDGALMLLHVLSCAPSAPSFASAVVRIGKDGAAKLDPVAR